MSRVQVFEGCEIAEAERFDRKRLYWRGLPVQGIGAERLADNGAGWP
jgi:hypothetical protein